MYMFECLCLHSEAASVTSKNMFIPWIKQAMGLGYLLLLRTPSAACLTSVQPSSILVEIQCQCLCFSIWEVIHLNHSCHKRAGIHPQQSLWILHDIAREELMCSEILITCSSN